MPIKGLKGGVGTKALGYGLGAAEEETEPNFNQTVLLLHGDGSEGAGNTAALGNPNYKAFKDNSTSAHALKVDADAYGNDFSPYYYADGYWSNSFTADSLKVTTASDFDLSSNQEFSIEFFLNPSAINASWGIFFYANPNDNNFQISHDGSGNVDLRFAGSQIGTPFTLPLNTWSHLVITRDSSGYIRQFLDGVLKNYNQKTDAIDRDFVTIGDRNGGNHFLGYISNVRWVKDSIPTSYQTSETSTGTTVFTSPTAPLTTSSQGATSSDVKLLTCQSNRFKDTSDNQTFTFNGTPKVSTNTPFTQSKTANVGSGFFDGTDDHVEIATASSDFNLGTGQFTFEAWVYTQSTDQQTIMIAYVSTTDFNIYLHYDAVSVYTSSEIINGDDGAVESFIQKHAWNHVVVQRDSSNYLTMYVNGVRKYYTVVTTDFGATSKIRIGEHENNGNGFKGYIADVRFVKGSAVYSGATITVPTSSLTAVTNTKLLTCQYSGAVRNVGFVDDSKYNHQVIRNGDTTMGTFSPFSLEDGYWSYYGGNTGSYYFADSADLEIGTSDFTIEFWMNLDTISGGDYLTGKVPSSGAGGDTAFQIYMSGSAGVLNYWLQDTVDTTTISTPSSTISAHTWHFISCVRQSGTMRLYVDGVQKATGTRSGSVKDVAGGVGIGMTGEFADYLAGYMSNYRFVIGTCLRNDGTTFSVPTTPLTSTGSETKILTAQSNKFVDNSSTGRTPVFSGTGYKILPFSPFAPSRSYSKDAVGGSAYFDGTGDDLTIIKSNPTQMLTSNWTIEMWVYITETGNIALIDHRGSNGDWGNQSTNGLNFQFYATSSTLYWQVASGTYLGGSYYPTPHSWNHFAVTNDGTQTTVFLNGTQIMNGSSGSLASLAAGSAIDRFTIGRNPSGYDTEGYIGPVKIHLTEHYDADASTITVPTAPFTADANTFLLLNFNNAGIIDHTMKNNLETEANTRVSGQQTKFGTGSIYFDGTGDKLVIPHQEYQQLGTDEFTVELFVYFTSTDQRQGFFGNDTGWYFQIYDGELEFALSTSAVIERSFSHSINQWYHLAATRDSSNDIRLFIDGTQQGAVVNSTADLRHASNDFHIGNIGPATSRLFKGGYMDEIRITKGVARYTSNFTVPTKAFANR